MTTDFTKIFQNALSSAPVDMSVFGDAFKSQAAYGEKLAKVALGAADKSADISSKWTKDAIAKLTELSKANSDPSEYTKAVGNYATASAELAAQHFAAFAEVAKKAQAETVELLMAAGKEVTEGASAAVKKATDEAAEVAKKANIASVK